jgi:hypothetical protein
MTRGGRSFVTQGTRLVCAAVLGAALTLAVGCASQGKQSIAEGARLVKSGSGSVEYTARSAGTVYVLDADQNRLIALAGMRPGQTARTDAARGEVLIDDKVITQHPIRDNRRYQFYFRPDNERRDR